jgi:hypothetical protein
VHVAVEYRETACSAAAAAMRASAGGMRRWPWLRAASSLRALMAVFATARSLRKIRSASSSASSAKRSALVRAESRTSVLTIGVI